MTLPLSIRQFITQIWNAKTTTYRYEGDITEERDFIIMAEALKAIFDNEENMRFSTQEQHSRRLEVNNEKLQKVSDQLNKLETNLDEIQGMILQSKRDVTETIHDVVYSEIHSHKTQTLLEEIVSENSPRVDMDELASAVENAVENSIESAVQTSVETALQNGVETAVQNGVRTVINDMLSRAASY